MVFGQMLQSFSRGILRAAGIGGFAVFVVAMGPTAATAQDASALFQRAASRYNAAATLNIEFQQTLTNALTGSTSTTRGKLLRKAPNLLSINFSEPAEDRIVNDGKSIWLYLPSTAPGQVIKIPVKSADRMMVDPLGYILSSSKSEYTIKLAGKTSVNGTATQGVTLTPIAKDAVFTSATVWIGEKDGSVHQLEVKEPSGLQRKIVVTKYTEGRTIPASAFRFTVPPKVRIIDQQALMGKSQ